MSKYAVMNLKKDPVTGKYVLDVGYESDKDALPFEHEEEHRKMAIGVVGEEGMKGHKRVSDQRGGSGGDDGDGQIKREQTQEG